MLLFLLIYKKHKISCTGPPATQLTLASEGLANVSVSCRELMQE